MRPIDAIGEEAARLGIDDILYDCVRRPDAFMNRLHFPLQGDRTPEDAIVGFLEASQPRIHRAGARLGRVLSPLRAGVGRGPRSAGRCATAQARVAAG